MKRILALCLSLLIVLGIMPVAAFAQADAPAFVVTGGQAAPGETVEVAVSVANNSGIVSLKVMVGYDRSALQLDSIAEQDFYGISHGPLTNNPIAVNWLDSLNPNNTTNGVVAVLTFTVLEGAQVGETPITLTYNPNDVFDFDMNNVAFDVVEGVVTVGCSHANAVTVPAKESTCVTQGNGEYTYCDACQTVIAGSNELLPLDENNHEGNLVVVGAKDPSYDEEGYTGDTICDACKTVVIAGQSIPKLEDINSGLVKDGDVYRYMIDGVAQSGWFEIDGNWYYFFADTMAAKAGDYQVGDVTYTFEETGKTAGVWAKTLYGSRYYYGPDYYRNGWATIDGNRYYFEGGYRYEGIRLVFDGNRNWYNFGDNGVCRDEVIADGFYQDGKKGLGYVVNGVGVVGLYEVEGDYYYFAPQEGYAAKGLFDGYLMGDDYKAVTGLTQVNGVLCYYEKGRPYMAGLIEIDGDLYFAYGVNGEVATETTYVWQGNGILPEGTYEFDANGKMVGGIVEKDGTKYYYKNGKPCMAGLIEIDGDYYFAGGANGEILTGWQYVFQNDIGVELENPNCEFGPDGKMYNGIVNKDGALYYYVMGRPQMAGLVEVDGDYYFAYGVNGEVTVNTVQYIWKNDIGVEFENPNCEFGADGKMLNGIVEKDGTLYYYVMGRQRMAGLIEIDGDYYFAGGANGEITVNMVQYIWLNDIGVELENPNCEFGPDGKMLNGIVEKDGTLYYYVMGRQKMAGTIEVDGDIYFANGANGEVATGTTYVWQGNGILAESTYEFGTDGKLLNGIVEKDGQLYYYVTGRPYMAGLIEIDGEYYFAGGASGEVLTGSQYVWQPNGLIEEGTYLFGEDGKMLDGFVTEADGIHYYENGKYGNYGLNYIDGNYYFVDYYGKIWTNGTYYVWDTNGLSLPMEYTFDELGRIVL